MITGLLAQILSRPGTTTSTPTVPEEKPKETATPSPQPASLPVLETDSYRMTIESVKKSGNTLTMVMIFENLTSKTIFVGMNLCGDATHLLDDVGEKWIVKSDTAAIFGKCGGSTEIAPRSKRRTNVSINTDESGTGNVFTFVLQENNPQSRKHVMHNIKVEQR